AAPISNASPYPKCSEHRPDSASGLTPERRMLRWSGNPRSGGFMFPRCVIGRLPLLGVALCWLLAAASGCSGKTTKAAGDGGAHDAGANTGDASTADSGSNVDAGDVSPEDAGDEDGELDEAPFSCAPTSCSLEGAACGRIEDGCGGSLLCGA